MSANQENGANISAGEVAEAFSAPVTGPTTMKGAVERMNAIVSPEPIEPTEEIEAEAAPEQQPEQADTPEPVEEELSTDDQPDSEVRMHTVKVNGEEFEVTEDDLRSGYMMEADYRNKTKVTAELRDSLTEKIGQLDEVIGNAEALLETDLTNLESPRMLELKETNPEAYLKEFDRVQAKSESLNNAKAQRAVEAKAERAELAKKESELLVLAIPEWLDPDIKAKEGAAIIERWRSMGYSEQKIADTIDHVPIAESLKAMRYDKLMSQDLESKKVKVAPKSQKPGTPKAGTDRTSEKIKGMRNQLRKTGKLKDAAALLKQRNR